MRVGKSFVRRWNIAYRLILATKDHNPFLDLTLRSIQSVQESHDVLRLFSINPIFLVMIC